MCGNVLATNPRRVVLLIDLLHGWRWAERVRVDRDSEAHAGLVAGGLPLFGETSFREWVSQARERSPGEILDKAFTCKPWKGENPREDPAAYVLITRGCARDSRDGSKPRNRGLVGRPGTPVPGKRRGETVCGSIRLETPGNLSRGEHSEGWIPGAPPVWNKTGTVSEGPNRREGSETLRVEASGRCRLAGHGSPIPRVLKGKRAQERSRWLVRVKTLEQRLGFVGKRSRRRRNSKRGCLGAWPVPSPPLEEDRKAGEKANGIAGASKPYGRYLSGGRTLDE